MHNEQKKRSNSKKRVTSAKKHFSNSYYNHVYGTIEKNKSSSYVGYLKNSQTPINSMKANPYYKSLNMHISNHTTSSNTNPSLNSFSLQKQRNRSKNNNKAHDKYPKYH